MSLPAYDFPREDYLARADRPVVAFTCCRRHKKARSCHFRHILESELRVMAPVSNPEKEMDGPDGGEFVFGVVCLLI